jgi:hypothetical protein
VYNLRPHQIEKSQQLVSILKTYRCAYLRGEVRSGKTITVLETARIYKAKKVLFLTKKKAITSIQSDYDNFGFEYEITITNYESIHKIKDINFDLIIYDEAHCLGAYPKPAVRTKLIKKMFSHIPCILLSGTPSAESYSQFYHQFYVSDFTPFIKFTNFYKWSKEFVTVTKKKIGTHEVNDYSDAHISDIEKIIIPYSIIMTQQDAGFETTITETILNIETPASILNLVKRLIKDRAIEGTKGYLMAESPAKLQSKCHQIFNGTVILEDENQNNINHIFSTYKAQYIKERFKGVKIVVMYYYQNELEVLKSVFSDEITTCIDEFNSSNKNFAIQQSSTEGMNISKADALVYYNLGFSGKNYIQSRDRLTIKDRKNNNVYIVCESGGMTAKILQRVKDKKSYNNKLFLKDFESAN